MSTTKRRVIGWIIAAVMAVGVAWSLWLSMSGPSINQAVAVPATPAPEIKRETPVIVPIKSIQAYAPKSKAKLKLPELVVENPDYHLVAASRVKSSDHPTTVSTVVNSETGKVETYVKEEPLPWLAFDPHGEAGIYVGVKNGQQAARLEVRQGIVQIKAVHLGAIASIDQPLSGPIKADYFAGVGAWYRW